jgi:hypothetical protein
MAPTKKALAEWEAAGAVAKEKPKTRFRLEPVFDRSHVEPLPAPGRAGQPRSADRPGPR